MPVGSLVLAPKMKSLREYIYNTQLRCYMKLIIFRSGPSKPRKLDDEELDSGDDENRNDRMEDGLEGYDDDGYGQEPKTQTVLALKLGRHKIPRGSDGEVSTSAFPLQTRSLTPESALPPPISPFPRPGTESFCLERFSATYDRPPFNYDAVFYIFCFSGSQQYHTVEAFSQ